MSKTILQETKKSLTYREKLFCHLLRADKKYNQTKAAIGAGYSPKSARNQAFRMMKNDDILKYLRSLDEPILNKLNITAQRILNELSKVAFTDIHTIFDKNGDFVSPKDIPDDMAAAIMSVKILCSKVAGSKDAFEKTKEIRLHDKIAALNALSKHVTSFPVIPTGDEKRQESNTYNFIDWEPTEIERFIRNRMQETRARNSNPIYS